jgi:hypothetical protein
VALIGQLHAIAFGGCATHQLKVVDGSRNRFIKVIRDRNPDFGSEAVHVDADQGSVNVACGHPI